MEKFLEMESLGFVKIVMYTRWQLGRGRFHTMVRNQPICSVTNVLVQYTLRSSPPHVININFLPFCGSRAGAD